MIGRVTVLVVTLLLSGADFSAARFLQVDAVQSGIVDRMLQTIDGYTYSLAVGAQLAVSRRWSLAGEVFYTPLEVVRPARTSSQNDELLHVRLMTRFRVR